MYLSDLENDSCMVLIVLQITTSKFWHAIIAKVDENKNMVTSPGEFNTLIKLSQNFTIKHKYSSFIFWVKLHFIFLASGC